MDPKVASLKRFYRGLLSDKAKIETHDHGFTYLEGLLSTGASLEYGELTGHQLLHKYKLTSVSEQLMDTLLEAHVAKSCNVCLYFHEKANRLFCFNLDNNHKTNNTELIPELELATENLREALVAVGIEPLIVASGRGYHLWCRVDQAVENRVLYELMVRLAAKSLAVVHQHGLDGQNVKFNFYPDPRSIDVVSLRLFGSDHAKNRIFSQIRAADRLLDEAASWKLFEQLAERNPTPFDVLSAAHESLMNAF